MTTASQLIELLSELDPKEEVLFQYLKRDHCHKSASKRDWNDAVQCIENDGTFADQATRLFCRHLDSVLP